MPRWTGGPEWNHSCALCVCVRAGRWEGLLFASCRPPIHPRPPPTRAVESERARPLAASNARSSHPNPQPQPPTHAPCHARCNFCTRPRQHSNTWRRPEARPVGRPRPRRSVLPTDSYVLFDPPSSHLKRPCTIIPHSRALLRFFFSYRFPFNTSIVPPCDRFAELYSPSESI